MTDITDNTQSCPGCGDINWNDLGCMTCGLEFWPPSEAYQDAASTTRTERIAELRAACAPALPPLPRTASPIERLFWDAHLRLGLPELNGLVFQHPAGRYRVDFALPAHLTGIELDGYATHSSTSAIARDRRRQRDLEAQGWRIIRFGGQEVHRDADGCVRQAACLVRAYVRRGAK